ncbi:hypothetical protein ABT095_02190 [Kitasatospora sp. NPDC002227]|uniref:hypothetical protein n=1 Tax=Kitasatospora sp. NPDC002227 TaxID=3154773 RepID=UPI00331C6733
MAALAWLIIPVIAAVLAMVWAGWAARTPRSTGDPASLAEHQRFLAAMERSTRTGAGVGEGGGPR